MTKRQNLQVNYSLSLRRLSFPQCFVRKIVEHTEELKECLEGAVPSLCLASLLVSAAYLPIQPRDCYLALSLDFRVFQGSSDFVIQRITGNGASQGVRAPGSRCSAGRERQRTG